MNSHFTLYNMETSNNNILYIYSPCKWRLRNECVFIILAYFFSVYISNNKCHMWTLSVKFSISHVMKLKALKFSLSIYFGFMKIMKNILKLRLQEISFLWYLVSFLIFPKWYKMINIIFRTQKVFLKKVTRRSILLKKLMNNFCILK